MLTHGPTCSAPPMYPGYIETCDMSKKGIGQAMQPDKGIYNPKGPYTQIVYTLGPQYLYGEYFKAAYILFGHIDP